MEHLPTDRAENGERSTPESVFNEINVVIVEDSPQMQEALQHLFITLGGFDVLAVLGSEDQAMAWFLEHPGAWDLAVVDLALKDGSGMNVIHRCNQIRTAGMVVVLSENVTPGVEERCKQVGADWVFRKSETRAFIEFVAGLAAR